MTQIIQPISNHPVLLNSDGTGKPRAIRVKQIAYIDFDIKEAKVIWEELFLDSEGNPIIDDTVANRQITSHICNSNTVTDQGIVIDSENFPKLEEESDEDYQARIEAIKEKGYPEFDFYTSMILNSEAIKQAIQVLDHLNRFNRK